MAVDSYTEKQFDILVLLSRISSSISCLSCCYILWSVLSNRYHRSRIYHRLMVGFAVAVLFTSIIFLWGPAAVPESMNASSSSSEFDAYSGTIQTCTIQGFFTQLFTFTGLFYYTSIAFYSLFAMRNKFDTMKLRKIEPWLHICPFIFPIFSAIYMIPIEAYNLSGIQTCWIEGVPTNCGNKNEDGIECVRGPQNIGFYIWVFGAIPTFLSLLVPTLVMFALYLYVRIKQKKHQMQIQSRTSTATDGSDNSNTNNEHRQRVGEESIEPSTNPLVELFDAKTVAKQAGLYLLAIYWSYIFLYVQFVLERVFHIENYPIRILSSCQLRLLGFYSMLAYLKLRHSQPTSLNSESSSRGMLKNSSRHNNGSIEVLKSAKDDNAAFSNVTNRTVSIAGITSARTIEERRNSNNNNNSSSNSRPSTPTLSSGQFEFSIFDGQRPSAEWADYIFTGDEEDEDEEEMETKKWADIQSHL